MRVFEKWKRKHYKQEKKKHAQRWAELKPIATWEEKSHFAFERYYYHASNLVFTVKLKRITVIAATSRRGIKKTSTTSVIFHFLINIWGEHGGDENNLDGGD